MGSAGEGGQRLAAAVSARHDRSMTRLHTRPESQRLSGDAVIRDLSAEAFESLPHQARREVEEYLQGVFAGQAQPAEEHVDIIYKAYAPVRRALLKSYGPRVHLYRGEPTAPPRIRRRFLSWRKSVV